MKAIPGRKGSFGTASTAKLIGFSAVVSLCLLVSAPAFAQERKIDGQPKPLVVQKKKGETGFFAKKRLSISSCLELKDSSKLILLEMNAVEGKRRGTYDVSDVAGGKVVALLGFIRKGSSVITDTARVWAGKQGKTEFGGIKYTIGISEPVIGDYKREKTASLKVSVSEEKQP